jgi:hypothetical protein
VKETKSEIRARIDELERTRDMVMDVDVPLGDQEAFQRVFDLRLKRLEAELANADEDIFKSVIRSHVAVCAAKKMDEKAAYGQDPAMYYSLAVCGEAGEMGNKIVKALRNGNDPEASRRAVISELPDVFIYGAVLAHVLDIDLTKLVNEKVDVVIQRAEGGYYGGALGQNPSD